MVYFYTVYLYILIYMYGILIWYTLYTLIVPSSVYTCSGCQAPYLTRRQISRSYFSRNTLKIAKFAKFIAYEKNRPTVQVSMMDGFIFVKTWCHLPSASVSQNTQMGLLVPLAASCVYSKCTGHITKLVYSTLSSSKS